MWMYEKKLQFPVNITTPDPAFAKIVISQIGGPDGELSASMRYLNQRYSMPYNHVRAMLTDIGTEEYAPKSCLSKNHPPSIKRMGLLCRLYYRRQIIK